MIHVSCAIMISSETKTDAFILERFLELDNWHIVEMTDGIAFDIFPICPADDTPLHSLCALVSRGGTKIIRIGSCFSCGYVGYIDRPTQKWVENFYTEEWDTAQGVNNEVVIKERREEFAKHGFAGFKNARLNQVMRFLQHNNLSKERSILDIGCGFGTSLKLFEKFGFKNLYGIENSRHRAAVASSAYDLHTMTGAFEDPAVQQSCRTSGPFGLIISHHVMEHVYDPQKIIRLAADLQEKNDYLMMSMPNLKGEPSMQTMIYWPHLHSFTKESFARLLARYGYEVLDDSFTTRRELFFLAKKTGNKKIIHQSGTSFLWVKNKFFNALHLGNSHWFSHRRLWWYRPLGIDSGGQIPFFDQQALDTTLYELRLGTDRIMRKRRSAVRQSCLITDVGRRYTSAHEVPLEIQFEGNILMTYK